MGQHVRTQPPDPNAQPTQQPAEADYDTDATSNATTKEPDDTHATTGDPEGTDQQADDPGTPDSQASLHTAAPGTHNNHREEDPNGGSPHSASGESGSTSGDDADVTIIANAKSTKPETTLHANQQTEATTTPQTTTQPQGTPTPHQTTTPGQPGTTTHTTAKFVTPKVHLQPKSVYRPTPQPVTAQTMAPQREPTQPGETTQHPPHTHYPRQAPLKHKPEGQFYQVDSDIAFKLNPTEAQTQQPQRLGYQPQGYQHNFPPLPQRFPTQDLTPIKIDSLPVKLASYSGNPSEDADNFISNFKLSAEVLGWAERKQPAIFHMCLKGTAKIWFQQLDYLTSTSIEQIIVAFLTIFKPLGLDWSREASFPFLRQMPTETWKCWRKEPRLGSQTKTFETNLLKDFHRPAGPTP